MYIQFTVHGLYIYSLQDMLVYMYMYCTFYMIMHFTSKICSLSIKERLTKSAVVTKFSRLCVECQDVMQTTVKEQCDRLDKDIEKKRSLLT